MNKRILLWGRFARTMSNIFLTQDDTETIAKSASRYAPKITWCHIG